MSNPSSYMNIHSLFYKDTGLQNKRMVSNRNANVTSLGFNVDIYPSLLCITLIVCFKVIQTGFPLNNNHAMHILGSL